MPVRRLTVVALLLAAGVTVRVGAASAGEALWQHEVSVPRAPRRGKPQKPGLAHLWLPPKCASVRGILFGQRTLLEKRLTKDPTIRKVAAEESLAVLYVDPSFDILFNYVEKGAAEKLERMLAELAAKCGHPELEHAPMLTIGHSTGGIFARNVAYWKPHRVIGIIHIKSGNLHQHVYGERKTLDGVPFLAINGELEEHGPEGGIRPEYRRQTQWVMIRKAMLERRAKDPANLMSLVVHPGGNHTSWSDDLSRYCALFIRKAVKHRVPREKADGTSEVHCLAIQPESGWLTDANIKAPRHKPAACADYTGDKAKAFWHLDKEMALATWNYHRGKLAEPDPSLKEGFFDQ